MTHSSLVRFLIAIALFLYSGEGHSPVITLAGNPGTWGFNDGVGTQANFGWPEYGYKTNLAVEPISGNLLICDWFHLRVMDLSGNVTSIYGSFAEEGPVGSIAERPIFVGQGRDNGPILLFFYGSQLQYQLLPLSGGGPESYTTNASVLAGNVSEAWGSDCSLDGDRMSARFCSPGGIAASIDDNLIFVSDTYGNCIRSVLFPQGIVTTIAGICGWFGYEDSYSGPYSGGSARFSNPVGIAARKGVEGGIILYVADSGNFAIRFILISEQYGNWMVAEVSTFAGGSYGTNDGIGTLAQFMSPFGIALSPQVEGTVYVSDYYAHNIRAISPYGLVATIAGNTDSWHPGGYLDALGTNALFNYPRGLAISADGEAIYVEDSGSFAIRGIITCSKGKFVAENAIACSTCPPGSFCNGGTISECPAGTFSEGGSFECTKCDAGLTASSGAESRSACVPCRPGHFINADGECTGCAANTTSTITGATSCDRCPTYSFSVPLSTSCTAINTFADCKNSTPSCVTKSAFTLSETLQAIVARSNGVGTFYEDYLEYFQVIQAKPGHRVKMRFTEFDTEADFDVLYLYNSSKGPFRDRHAPNIGVPVLGPFSGLKNPSDPFFEQHFFSSFGGSLVVQLITDASITKSGIVMSSTSEKCPAGSSCPIGSMEPVLCPMGSWAGPGLVRCIPCEAGFWSNVIGRNSSCSLRCDEGFYCPAGSTNSTASECPITKYSDSGAGSLSDCLSCPLGSYCPGARTHLLCSPGSYAPVLGRSSCIPCPAGSFTDFSGSSFCDKFCSPGTYRSRPGGNSSSSCSPCPSGTFSDVEAGIFCEQCPQGTANANIGSTARSACVRCGPNEYASAGSATCDTCEEGSAPNAAQSQCVQGRVLCDDGYNLFNSSGTCEEGYYCPLNSTNATAIPCPVTTTSASGACALSQCHPCALGSYCVGGSPAALCHPGSFSPVVGRDSCILCAAGSWTSAFGATICDKFCARGSFRPQPGGNSSASCTLCPEGTFSEVDGAVSCTPCPAGRASMAVGATSSATCASCSANEYAPAGSGSCSPCPAGFKPDPSQSLCIANTFSCPDGYASKHSSLTPASLNDCRLLNCSAPLVASHSTCLGCPANFAGSLLSCTRCQDAKTHCPGLTSSPLFSFLGVSTAVSVAPACLFLTGKNQLTPSLTKPASSFSEGFGAGSLYGVLAVDATISAGMALSALFFMIYVMANSCGSFCPSKSSIVIQRFLSMADVLTPPVKSFRGRIIPNEPNAFGGTLNVISCIVFVTMSLILILLREADNVVTVNSVLLLGEGDVQDLLDIPLTEIKPWGGGLQVRITASGDSGSCSNPMSWGGANSEWVIESSVSACGSPTAALRGVAQIVFRCRDCSLSSSSSLQLSLHHSCQSLSIEAGALDAFGAVSSFAVPLNATHALPGTRISSVSWELPVLYSLLNSTVPSKDSARGLILTRGPHEVKLTNLESVVNGTLSIVPHHAAVNIVLNFPLQTFYMQTLLTGKMSLSELVSSIFGLFGIFSAFASLLFLTDLVCTRPQKPTHASAQETAVPQVDVSSYIADDTDTGRTRKAKIVPIDEPEPHQPVTVSVVAPISVSAARAVSSQFTACAAAIAPKTSEDEVSSTAWLPSQLESSESAADVTSESLSAAADMRHEAKPSALISTTDNAEEDRFAPPPPSSPPTWSLQSNVLFGRRKTPL